MASLKYQLFRLRFALMLSGAKRTKTVQKGKIFNKTGKNVLWQPRKLPSDPNRIRLHNNIQIASGVTFVNHDIIGYMLNRVDPGFEYSNSRGCIEVMDNVSIGSNTIIMPNVRIGQNVVIGAGSIVTKDIPSGVVVAGIPAKIIGSFDDFLDKRKEKTVLSENIMTDEELWEDFYLQRKYFFCVIVDA